MRRIVLIFIAVFLLCACASNTSANQQSTNFQHTGAPAVKTTSEPTVGPAATSVPKASGYFEIHTTLKVDEFGSTVREIKEIVATVKAVDPANASIGRNTVFFIFDRGSRWAENTFFIYITRGKELPTTIWDEKHPNDDHISISSWTSFDSVKYRIDDTTYTVPYEWAEVLVEDDFDRIYAALLSGKDVAFSCLSGQITYAFTIHGEGFAEIVSSLSE